MILRRGRVLLRLRELIQFRLGCRVGRQHKHHPFDRFLRRHCAALKFRPRQGMAIARQYHGNVPVYYTHDTFGRLNLGANEKGSR